MTRCIRCGNNKVDNDATNTIGYIVCSQCKKTNELHTTTRTAAEKKGINKDDLIEIIPHFCSVNRFGGGTFIRSYRSFDLDYFIENKKNEKEKESEKKPKKKRKNEKKQKDTKKKKKKK